MNKVSKIPGRKELYPITRTEGSEPLAKPSAATQNQIDSTVREDYSKEGQQRELAAQREQRSVAPSHIQMPDTTPTADDVVSIGDVTIQRSRVGGFERSFTRNPSDFDVYQGEDLVHPNQAVGVIFAALREQAKPKVVKK